MGALVLMAWYAGASLAAADGLPDDHPPWEPSDLRRRPLIDLEREPVIVELFPLQPLGGWGAAGSSWEIHPKALLGVAWDSDPNTARGGSAADVQTRLAAGCEARLHAQEDWRADLGGMLRQIAYAETPSRNMLGGDAQVRLQHDGPTTTLAAEASWIRDAEPQPQLPEMVERERWTASLSGSDEHRAWGCSGTLAWNRLDYLEDAPGFDRDQHDVDRLRALGAWNLIGARESRLGIEVAGEAERRNAPANGHRAGSIHGRWQHPLGERTALELRLGATAIRYADDSFADPANADRSLVAATGSTRLRWTRDLHTWCYLAASSGPAEGVVDGVNSTRRALLEASARVGLYDRLDLTLVGWLSHRADLAAPAGEDRRVTDDAYLRLGVEYRLRDGLGLRLWGSWQRSEANAGATQQRTLIASELVLAL